MAKAEPETRAMSIRGIPSDVYEDLRVRAAKHGHSMEAEVRDILATAVEVPDEDEEESVGAAFDRIFAGTGGLDIELPSRDDAARWVEFDE